MFFHILAIVYNAAMNVGEGYTYLLKLVFSFSSDKYPEVELLCSMIVLFLILGGMVTLFSIVDA